MGGEPTSPVKSSFSMRRSNTWSVFTGVLWENNRMSCLRRSKIPIIRIEVYIKITQCYIRKHLQWSETPEWCDVIKLSSLRGKSTISNMSRDGFLQVQEPVEAAAAVLEASWFTALSPKLWFPPPQTPYSPTAPGTGVQPWLWKPGRLQEPYSGSDNPG